MLRPMDLKGGMKENHTLEDWRQYPVIQEPAAANTRSFNDRIADFRSTVFSELSSDTNVEIIDINTTSQATASKMQFYTSIDVERHLLQSAIPTSRIISLHSQNSLSPLKITEECLRNIFSHLDVGTEFLGLILAVGEKPRDSEAGLGGWSMKIRPDGSYDVCYMMVYVEENRGKEKTSWPIRQTAVFHRFVPKSEGSFWIFVHPMPNSVLKNRLEDSVIRRDHLNWYKSGQQLHYLAVSSYIDNWRWYLKFISEELERIADVALTLEFSRPEDYTDGFRTLTRLQYLQERILPLFARFETSKSTANGLQNMNNTFHDRGLYEDEIFTDLTNAFVEYESKYRGYITSATLLKSRVKGILKMLTVALSLKNQATSVDINHNMLLLTRDTVDDSATVRVVTLVTLIYLPASFVSSLLGMNLFAFQSSDGAGFQISKQFWIFVVLTVPLTILTVGSWFYIAHVRRRDKAAKARSEQLRLPGSGV